MDLLPPDYHQAESSKKDTEGPPPCICPKSHCTSGLRAIADLLNTGAVCGVPTDTVYALAASCRHPQAIEKVYRIKVWIQDWHLVIWILLASHRWVTHSGRNGSRLVSGCPGSEPSRKSLGGASRKGQGPVSELRNLGKSTGCSGRVALEISYLCFTEGVKQKPKLEQPWYVSEVGPSWYLSSLS